VELVGDGSYRDVEAARRGVHEDARRGRHLEAEHA
jgi:hypothetical protein